MAKSEFATLVITLLALRLGGETPRPVKLQVDLSTKSVSFGECANMNVHLLDGDNQPVPAPKDFKIEIAGAAPIERHGDAGLPRSEGGTVVDAGGTPSCENGRLVLHLGQVMPLPHLVSKGNDRLERFDDGLPIVFFF